MEPDRITWKEKLGEKIPAELGREIDIFEQQMQLRKQGKIDEKVFAETRLRRGIYGQRYDNGQRHDGKRVQKLKTPTERRQGAGHVVGCAGHDADQDSLRRRDSRATGDSRRSVGRVCRRRDSCHDSARLPIALRSYRRHSGVDAPPCRSRNHQPGGLRQRRAQCDGMPAGRHLPPREFRYHPVREGLLEVFAGASRHAGFWPKIQGRFLRVQRKSVRARHHA